MEYYQIWFSIIAFYYTIILFGYIHYSNKEDNLNNIIAFGTLLFVFIHIFIFLALMSQEAKLRFFMVPLWLLLLGIPPLLISIVVIITTIFVSVYEKMSKNDLLNIGRNLERKKEAWSKAKRDTHRKINHVLIFIGLVLIWYIGLLIAHDYTGSSVGMIPEENNMLLLYFRLLTEPNSIREVLFSLGWFYYILFFFFYIFSLFMLSNEFARKTNNLSFPFTFFTKIYLSEKEKQNYGTYMFFAIGQMFSAFTCPPMVFFTILGIGSLSDLMTSQIGIRFGKTSISWNKNKTWEGTIAGTLVTLIICFLFMGIFWALIFTIAFISFDILTDRPISLSDNLLIPIGCSLIFLSVRFFFDLDYFTI
ncbi:MAG: hypothetical protein ACFE8B_12870, partial [Candidatus Hermodarchaeota archaeon]